MKLRHLIQKQTSQDEQGIALVISLLMGMLLITAATGLVVRQLTARKLGASESYQQMAETAASNGFNRIIAVINNSDESNYRGFLLTEDNQPSDNAADNWRWEKPWQSTYVKGDFCAERAGLPPIADRNGGGIETTADGSSQSSASNQWPRSSAGYVLNTASLRSDGLGDVQSTFRLRSYTKDFSSGRGTGTFEVEGIVWRTGIDNVEDKTLARARLTRSLQLESSIARPQDWGVLAARFFNDEGSTTVNGPGRFIWFVGSPNTDRCDDNFNTVSAKDDASLDIVWPVLLDSDTPYIPAHTIYNRDGTEDEINYNGQDYIRVWSFDDTEGGLDCGDSTSIVCTRPGALGEETIPTLHTLEQSAITDQQEASSGDDGMEYKTIKFNKNGKKFWIGTCKDKKILKPIAFLPIPTAIAGIGTALTNGGTALRDQCKPMALQAQRPQHQADWNMQNATMPDGANPTKTTSGTGRMSSAPNSQLKPQTTGQETPSKSIAMTSAHKRRIQMSAICTLNTSI